MLNSRFALGRSTKLRLQRFWLIVDGATVTMKGFGASAPANVFFKKFGFTKENVVATMKNVIEKL